MAKLNIATLNLDKEKIIVLQHDYDKNIYESFKKDNYNLIRIWKTVYYIGNDLEDERLTWFSEIEVNIRDFPQIFRKIVENWFINFFKSANLPIWHKRYSTIWWVQLSKKNIDLWNMIIYECLDFSININTMEWWNNLLLLSINRSYRTNFWEIETSIDTTHRNKNDSWDFLVDKKNIYLYLDSIGKRQSYEAWQKDLKDNKWFESFSWKILMRLQEIAKGRQLKCFWGIQISIEGNINIPNSHFNLESLNTPKYYMYNNRSNSDLPLGEKSNYYHEQLKKLFPYSHFNFQGTKNKILILSPNEHTLSIENFCSKLKKTLNDVFHIHVELDEKYIDMKWVENHFLWNKYLEAINEVQNLKDYSCVINVFKEEDKKIPIQESPYYQVKAKLLNQEIMSQEVTIETIKNLNSYILNNISLNIYWKLWGCARTIENDGRTTNEFVIWIWSTITKNKRIVWMANVFDYNGMYKVGDCYETSWMDDYWKLLEKTLKSIITNYIKDLYEAWNEIRIIFHLFKDSSQKSEINTIENIFNNSLGDWRKNKIKYCFLHLSYEHNFKSIQHQKGDLIHLNSYQSLLFINKKINTPIFIKIDKRSTFNEDIYGLSKQVFYFCHLSHRNFIPSSKPVSMLYAWLMARLSSSLNLLNNRDPEILSKINKKLWFI